MRKNLFRLALLAFLGLVTGCGSGRYPVTGTVNYEDGAPVEEATIIAEATVEGKAVGVQGNIRNGQFTWGGDRPGDGALPGNYKVIIMPPTIPDGPSGEGKVPAVSGKYTRYDSSGLSFEVKPASNEYKVTVTRPRSRNR